MNKKIWLMIVCLLASLPFLPAEAFTGTPQSHDRHAFNPMLVPKESPLAFGELSYSFSSQIALEIVSFVWYCVDK